MMNLMRSCNRQGASHRDGHRIGLKKVRSSVENGGLVEYFFGKDGNEALQHGKFVEFLKNLHNEVCHSLLLLYLLHWCYKYDPFLGSAFLYYIYYFVHMFQL